MNLQSPTFRIASSILILIVASQSAWAEHVFVYRWVNAADGSVHYSDSAPSGDTYHMIAIDKAPPVDTNLQRRLATMAQNADEFVEKRQHERAAKRLDAALAAARRQSCAQLRGWLAKLESRPGPKLIIVDSSGNASRMTEVERQNKMSLARQQIAGECKSTD